MDFSSPQFLFTVIFMGLGAFAAAKSFRKTVSYDKSQREATTKHLFKPGWEPLRTYAVQAPDLSNWAQKNGYQVLKAQNSLFQYFILKNKWLAPTMMVIENKNNNCNIYAYLVMQGQARPIIDNGSFRNKVATPIRKIFKDLKSLEGYLENKKQP